MTMNTGDVRPIEQVRAGMPVVDAEGATAADGSPAGIRLGLARPLAEAMGARYLTVDDLSAETIADAVRSALPKV